MKIKNDQGAVITSVTQGVLEGFEGMLLFTIPGGGIKVDVGRKYIIQLEDTGKIVFGWKYGGDSYANGVRMFSGEERLDYDHFFITYTKDSF